MGRKSSDPLLAALGDRLRSSEFGFITPGRYPVRSIYAIVKSVFPALCDDTNRCTHHGGRDVEPEWEHHVRGVLNSLKKRGLVGYSTAASEWVLGVDGAQPTAGDEVSLTEPLHFEGAVRVVLVEAFERDPLARAKCLKTHGHACVVCGFDFGREFGALADGFIHVHHNRPIATVRKRDVIDPVNGLCPVCPNCHAVIHLRNPPYSVAEVRAMRRRDTPPEAKDEK